MRKQFLLSLILIIEASLVIPTISCTGLQTEQPVPEKQQATKQAIFQLSPLTVSPMWLFVGDNATVSATVTNIGAADGTYTAIFTVDGQKADEKEIQLAQGQSSEVVFPIASTIQSNKTVAIGDSKAAISFYNGKSYSIQYDDFFGQGGGPFSAGSTWFAFEPWGQVVRFTPAAKPFRITKVKIAAVASFINKEERNYQFTINIYDSTGKKLWSKDYPWQIFYNPLPTLQDFDIPSLRVDGEFYIEIVSHTPIFQGGAAFGSSTYLGLGYNANDYETRSSFSYLGIPKPSSSAAGRKLDWAIRVEGEGGPFQVLYYDDAGADIYNATTDFSFINAFAAPSYPFDLHLIQLYGYRDIKDVGDRNITLKVIDRVTMQPIWQKNISWSEIPYSGTKLGTWADIDTGGITCNHDFFIELTSNNSSDAHIWLGCDTTAKNRNSDMSVGGNIITWHEWTDTSGTDIKMYTRDNTKWMIRVAGIVK